MPPSLFILPSASKNLYVLSGTACCLVSAVAYTAANVCMRQLTVLRCDPLLAVLGREFFTTVLVAPWLAAGLLRGRPTFPKGRLLVNLLLAGLFLQIVGNPCGQWALGAIGLAVTIPSQFGASITAGAVLGSLLLGERVSIRSISAIALLIAALILLGVGAEAVGQAIATADAVASGPFWTILAVVAAGVAGTSSALLIIVVRHSVTRAALPSAVAFLIPLMGIVCVGPMAVVRLGIPAILDTSGEQILLLVAAGSFNLIGFLGLIYGLQRTTVVHANVISASQVAIAAVAGLALFHEPLTLWLILGVCLMIVGIVWIDRPGKALENIQTL